MNPGCPKNETQKFLRVKKAAECGCRAAFFPAEMEFPLCSFIDHAECISPKVRKSVIKILYKYDCNLQVINFNYDRCGAEASETAQSFEHKCLPACESMRHITG